MIPAVNWRKRNSKLLGAKKPFNKRAIININKAERESIRVLRTTGIRTKGII